MPIICIALIGLISICVFLNLRKNMLLHFVIVFFSLFSRNRCGSVIGGCETLVAKDF